MKKKFLKVLSLALLVSTVLGGATIFSGFYKTKDYSSVDQIYI